MLVGLNITCEKLVGVVHFEHADSRWFKHFLVVIIFLLFAFPSNLSNLWGRTGGGLFWMPTPQDLQDVDSERLRHPQLMLASSLLQPEKNIKKNHRFWPHANRFLLNARLYHWSLSSATAGLQLSPRSSSGPIIIFIVVINPAIFTTVASITIVTYCNHCGVILCTSSAIISRWQSPTEVTNYMVRRS